MERRRFLGQGFGLPLLLTLGVQPSEEQPAPSAPEVEPVRVTPQHPQADRLLVMNKDGKKMLGVVWFELPTGRYCTIHLKVEDIAKYRVGVNGVEETAAEDGCLFVTHAPDGAYLVDRRTGKPFTLENV